MSGHEHSKFLEHIAHQAARWAGTSWAFLVAVGLILLWLVSGPFYGFANGWQLMMNTICSTVTFIMVFLLQRSHNKDSLSMQIKLAEFYF